MTDLRAVPDRHLNEKYCFRFISRGSTANALVKLAVRALRWCHPFVQVVVVDANDAPCIESAEVSDARVIHLSPQNDAVARCVGRGTPNHLFYWRHSPSVISAIASASERSIYDVYMDSDVLLLRPMSLSGLSVYLNKGRIAATVDEDSLLYAAAYETNAATLNALYPSGVGAGPLVQAGLIFSNRQDDGGLYQMFWQMAKIAANKGKLESIPYDDMAVLTAILSQGGPLWDRWLPLGHQWNFITDRQKDPGLYGIGAHFGGHRAKRLLLEKPDQFMVPQTNFEAWGSVVNERLEGKPGFQRGRVFGRQEGDVIVYRVKAPFTLSWALDGYRDSLFDIRFESSVTGKVVFSINGNTMDSCCIDQNGRINCRIPENTLGVLTATVEIESYPDSLYAQIQHSCTI